MGLGKHFQVRVLEQLGLSLIVNFLEFHTRFLEAAKIMKREWSMVNGEQDFVNDFRLPIAIGIATGQLSETDSLFALNTLLIRANGCKIYRFCQARRRYA